MNNLVIVGLLIVTIQTLLVVTLLVRLLRSTAQSRRLLDEKHSIDDEKHSIDVEDAGTATDASPPANAIEEQPVTSTTEDQSASAEKAEGDTLQDAPAADVYSFAQRIEREGFFSRGSHPRELLTDKSFQDGLELLKGASFTVGSLIGLYRQDYGGTNTIVACMALEALRRRPENDTDLLEPILNAINSSFHYTQYFALHTLNDTIMRPILADILVRLDDNWTDWHSMRVLREVVEKRVASGEVVTFANRLHALGDDQAVILGNIIEQLGDSLPETVRKELSAWRTQRVDLTFLRTCGRIWGIGPHRDMETASLVELDVVKERVDLVEKSLRNETPRSVMLVGESGVGKTTVVRLLANRFADEHWVIFESGASDLLAGQVYIGQLEERVQKIVKELGGKQALWVIPNFHELRWAGSYENNPRGILDILLPFIESGHIRIVGETSSVAYEKLVQHKPQLRTALEIVQLSPLSEEETLELARQWSDRRTGGDTTDARAPRISEQTLHEASQLARQYLGDRSAPGNLLQFLDAAYRLVSEHGVSHDREMTLDDLFVTLSQLTGLPVNMLDERRGIDLQELRAFFDQRVLGQREAVDCLVERVAMIKAGLTDPTRPQGVFLFVGPTGTGKTEIAKTLAEFLFGSPDRMIRLDMSEFQTPETLDRILGEAREAGEGKALVNAIRKQPFSVVLLDEFEKAHSNVWDLFLQVFDDGRLTDRRGNTADFRHCIVIMTSNVGATVPRGTNIGFSTEQAALAASSVERAVMNAFRREFINRLDRIVVFRPLERNVMRELLRKELSDVLHRRGLRNRTWAVEWDESAIEFLLTKGFTPDLGARPLKRAVERYLLSPLAMTIVNNQFPEGDQFLFVRWLEGEQLDVAFIDPDAPDENDDPHANADAEVELTSPHEPESVAQAEDLGLKGIALEARGALAEVRFLQQEFNRLEDVIEEDGWEQGKKEALARTASPDFWDSPGRFSVLGIAEYMDRIEAGLKSAGSLLSRLNGSTQGTGTLRRHFPSDLVRRLAERLYLLDAACDGLASGRPRDAFVSVRVQSDAATDVELSNAFAARVAEMYKRWAERRRMRFAVLQESETEGIGGDGNGNKSRGESSGSKPVVGMQANDQFHMMMAFSGFGAYTILQLESGLHVLETPQDDKSFRRARVHVRVVPQPDEPAGHAPDALRKQAARALEDDQNSASESARGAGAGMDGVPVVRRYREEPSPLVRDSIRQWRTGRIDRVLGGDFDLVF